MLLISVEPAKTGWEDGVLSEERAANQSMFGTEVGLIAILDALATKGSLTTRQPDELVARWSAILNLIDDSAKAAEQLECCSYVRPIAFSDTVIVPMIPRDPINFQELLSAMGSFLQVIFVTSLESGIFFRGAISAGSFFQSNSNIFGPAMDEAGAWFERSDWIGVSATPTLARLLDVQALNSVDLSPFFRRYPVPMKEQRGAEQFPGWALEWPRYARQELGESAEQEILSTFAKHSGPVTPEVALKYEQTLKFFRTPYKAFDPK